MYAALSLDSAQPFLFYLNSRTYAHLKVLAGAQVSTMETFKARKAGLKPFEPLF